jgi:hypothetical protein
MDAHRGTPVGGSRAAQKYIGYLLGVSDRTLRDWISGDHSSLSYRRPKLSTNLYTYINSFISDRHKHRAAVTGRHIINIS